MEGEIGSSALGVEKICGEGVSSLGEEIGEIGGEEFSRWEEGVINGEEIGLGERKLLWMWEKRVGAGGREIVEPLRAFVSGICTANSAEPIEVMSGPMLWLASALVFSARKVWEGPAKEADLVPRILQIGRIRLRFKTSSPGSLGHFATPP